MDTSLDTLAVSTPFVAAPARPRVRRASGAARAGRAGGFIGGILLQVGLCAVVVILLLLTGKLGTYGRCFWALLGLMVLRLAVLRRPEELLCLLLATAPFTNLLRDGAFYNVILVLFGGALVLFYLRQPAVVKEILARAPLAQALVAFASFYYVFSLVLTGNYTANLRLFELAGAVVSVLLIGRNRRLLGTALLGMTIAAATVGLGMLPHNDSVGRLGMVILDGYSLGNPAQLGLSLALAFLALVVDRGRWVNLEDYPVGRLLLLVPMVTLLALTTSRVGWIVAAIGVLVALLFRPRARFGIVLAIILATVAIRLVLLTPFGPALQAGLDRTFSSERSVANRTSGRSDQWAVAYAAFTHSARSLVCGYGPGSGATIYARFSPEVAGVRYGVGERRALHSLFMQVMVELGLLGLLPLVVWLGCVGGIILKWLRATGWMFPLVCFLGYGLIVLTVSGNDTASGTYMGIGLLATLRPVRANPAEDRNHA